MEVSPYKGSSDATWTQAQDFCRHLAELREKSFESYVNNDAGTMYKITTWIYNKIKPITKKSPSLMIEAYKKLLRAKKKLDELKDGSGRMVTENNHNINKTIVSLLLEVDGILEQVQYSHGLIMPKSEDPIKQMRKFGD